MSPPRSGAPDRLARVHGALGLLLGAYVVYHLWTQWPALAGRDAWLARARSVELAWVAGLVVLLVLGHAVLGFVRFRHDHRGASRDARGLGRLQASSGAVVFAFLAYHVVQVGAFSAGPHAHALSAHAILSRDLGRPFDLVLYVVGVTCVSFHFGHGLVRAASGWDIVRGDGAVRAARFVAGLAAFVLWLGLVHLLGVFASGEGLLPFGGLTGAAPS